MDKDVNFGHHGGINSTGLYKYQKIERRDDIMGEAIISRSGGGSGSDNVIVPITPGYHTVLVTLMSNEGRKLDNAEIRCNDGGHWFNYTTNESGQAMFATNSGTLYFFVNSIFKNNVVMIDQKNVENYKYDAPVGVSSKLNLKNGWRSYRRKYIF